MATTIYDVTLLQGIIAIYNSAVAIGFFILGWYIMSKKKYLRWKPHIYPVTMFGAFAFAFTQFWMLGEDYFVDMDNQGFLMHFFRLTSISAIGYAVWEDVQRLIWKYEDIQSKDKEIVHLKEKIVQLHKKYKGAEKVILFIVSMGILTSCGGYKKEIERLTAEKQQNIEMYEKRISELNSKITESQTKITETEQEKKQKETEVTTLKKELSEVREKLEKLEEEELVIKNADNVKITDSKGNTTEVQGGQGTEIYRTSISKLKTELSNTKQAFNNTVARATELTESLFRKESFISKLESDISEKASEIKKLKSKTEEQEEQLFKETTKKGISPINWILIGMGITILLQVLWWAKKFVKPIP